MSTKERLIPGPDHPITIAPTGKHVVVKAGGKVIAETDSALTLQESNYQPVQYLPLQDVDADVISPTDHETYCPYKGDASYYSLSTADGELENVIWTYEQPYDAVAEINGSRRVLSEQGRDQRRLTAPYCFPASLIGCWPAR
jgi:uncharacterized protein (DUF427 family)